MAIVVGMVLSWYRYSIVRRIGGGSFVNHAVAVAFLARLQSLKGGKVVGEAWLEPRSGCVSRPGVGPVGSSLRVDSC